VIVRTGSVAIALECLFAVNLSIVHASLRERKMIRFHNREVIIHGDCCRNLLAGQYWTQGVIFAQLHQNGLHLILRLHPIKEVFFPPKYPNIINSYTIEFNTQDMMQQSDDVSTGNPKSMSPDSRSMSSFLAMCRICSVDKRLPWRAKNILRAADFPM
jgi:hypothetical protein